MNATDSRKVQTCATPCDLPQHSAHAISAEGGVQTLSKSTAISALLEDRAAKSDALAITDAELLQVVQSWPNLPDPIKLAVLALVRSRLA